jgi:hypothetical protein
MRRGDSVGRESEERRGDEDLCWGAAAVDLEAVRDGWAAGGGAGGGGGGARLAGAALHDCDWDGGCTALDCVTIGEDCKLVGDGDVMSIS